jgi:hypothetical protein
MPISTLAESTSDVLRAFGLVGTWSLDCSKDPTKEAASRVVYKTSLAGAATYDSIIRFPNGQTVVSKNEIQQAVIIGEDKIKIIIRPLTITPSAGIASPIFFKIQEIITEKIGSKMHVLSNHFVDGTGTIIENGKLPNGTPTPLVEKCADPAG